MLRELEEGPKGLGGRGRAWSGSHKGLEGLGKGLEEHGRDFEEPGSTSAVACGGQADLMGG